MRYKLTRLILGSSAFTEINEDEHAELMNAAHDLIRVLSIEEQFDLVIENYFDVESNFLSEAVRSMVEFGFDYRRIQMQRNLIVNRRFLNVLSACKGYIDQTRHYLSSISNSPEPTFFDLFDRHTKEQYDESLGYRATEQLRNYMQHRAFPLSIHYNSAWVGGDENHVDEKSMILTVNAHLHLERIDRDKFKKAVYDELVKCGEPINVLPLLRQYVGSLGVVHENLRSDLKERVRGYDALICGAIQKFKTDHPSEKTSGLFAAALGDNSEIVQKTHLSKGRWSTGVSLRRKIAA